ncbi:MAG TPA: DUF5615 family PIN-like protein [Candidatus Hydrogenedentes bacterium]|nr:DUF5615 family PIN-like protein [Candidatus Hydrogenedentota bacterium]HPG67573.1 DUF5615 family PIN-like protein [Candidatus Hydrogenedentota bacterium]
MKLLLDACVWGGAKAVLRDAGHEVVWAGDWDRDPGDDEILAQAYCENRVLITLDKDFGELAIVRRRPHAGILRLVGFSGREQGAVCLRVLATHGAALESAAIVTVDRRRIRVRPLE